MKERSFDEMIAFFNRRVADMDISQDCKMELLGMVTALGYTHEKTAKHVVCRDCVMKNVCRYKTGLGDYGYCSQWKGEEHGKDTR